MQETSLRAADEERCDGDNKDQKQSNRCLNSEDPYRGMLADVDELNLLPHAREPTGSR
jgi:hypothetical protein